MPASRRFKEDEVDYETDGGEITKQTKIEKGA